MAVSPLEAVISLSHQPDDTHHVHGQNKNYLHMLSSQSHTLTDKYQYVKCIFQLL